MTSGVPGVKARRRIAGVIVVAAVLAAGAYLLLRPNLRGS
jgi:hypothetical protein